MLGIFGKMFDFNRDGKLNAWERAAEFQFLEMITKDDSDENIKCRELDEAGPDAAGPDADEYDFLLILDWFERQALFFCCEMKITKS